MRIGRIGAWTGAALGMMGMAGAAQAMTATNPGALDVVTVNAACTPIIVSFTTNITLTPTQDDGAGVDNAVIAAYDGAGALLRYRTVAQGAQTILVATGNFALNTAVAAATALPLQVRIVDVTGAIDVGSINAGTVLHTFTVADGLITGEDLTGCNALRRSTTTTPGQASSIGVISGVTRVQQDLMVGNTQRHLDNILQVQFGGGGFGNSAGGGSGSTGNPFAAAMSGLMYG